MVSSDSDAPYQFTLSGLSLGAQQLEARVFDSGNAISYGIANIAVVSSTPTSTVPSKPDVDSITSSTPKLSGLTTVNALITIYNNGVNIGAVTANGSGNWSYTVTPPLAAGTHVFTVTSTAPSATESAPSPGTIVTVSSGGGGGGGGGGAGGGSSTTPEKPAVSDPTSSTPTLSGITTPNALITIYDNGIKIGSVTADGLGKWSYTVSPPLSAGTHVLTVTSTAPSASESAPSLGETITVSGGGTTPSAPSSSEKSSSCGLGSALAFILLFTGVWWQTLIRIEGNNK